MLHAEAFLSSTRIACGFFSMRTKNRSEEYLQNGFYHRGGGIRTPGPMVPNHVLYQTEPHPDHQQAILYGWFSFLSIVFCEIGKNNQVQ